MRPQAPSGISTEPYSNSIRIRWRQSISPDIKGYNIYNSQTSGGGLSGYTKLNDALIQLYADVTRETTSSAETITETGNVRTTVTEDTLEQVYYYEYIHYNLKNEKEQYYVINAVNTNGEISMYSAEVVDKPIIVTTNLIDIPTRTKSDTILAYIDETFRRNPLIDLKPGTVTRDLHIDPHGNEFEKVYILLRFYFVSSSFVSLKRFDDVNGDGVSDEVTSSQNKIDLRYALGYKTDGTDDVAVQAFIDSAFDSLASNSNTTRKGNQNAIGSYIFYTTTVPTNDITIPAGTIVSTPPTQTSPSINFTTLSTVTFIKQYATTYYNQINQRYELSTQIEAMVAGQGGNKPANSIVLTTTQGFQGTNPFGTYNGREQEPNADLADRALLAYRAKDLGALNGYRRTTLELQNILDVMIIDAGHELMQRDYDDIRHRHLYGKVDIYFQGDELEEFTETVGFLYKLVENEVMDVVTIENPLTNLKLQTVNTNVTIDKPIFSVYQVRNLTQGLEYDVLGNVTIMVNTVPLIKGRFKECEIDLATGVIVFSTSLPLGVSVTAKYDSVVVNDVIIPSASGGELATTFSHIGSGIRQESYVIYKNSVALVETTDYTLIPATGHVTFTTPLSTGDIISADYAYIINEIVLPLSSGGEKTLTLTNPPIYPSVKLLDTQLEINRFNDINQFYNTMLSDIIQVTYRYRDSDTIILSNQPVRSISTIIGSISGQLVENVHYKFNRNDDIIMDGNSVRALRNVSFIYNPTDGKPSGQINNVVESIVLSGLDPMPLTYKGIDLTSILVQNSARTINYVQNIDYVITYVDSITPVTIHRLNTGAITNGQTVSVDYDYGEVLTIKYLTNNLVKKVQDVIEVERHITADVLAKESQEIKIDISVGIVADELSDKAQVKNNVLTSISDIINNNRMGDACYKSAIISAIQETAGVKYISTIPLTKMVRADGSMIIREKINTAHITWVIIPGKTKTWITTLQFLKEDPSSNGTFTVTTQHYPIIRTNSTAYNITTGETYTVMSFSNNPITLISTVVLSGIQAPIETNMLELTYWTRATALQYSTLGNANNTSLPYGVFEHDEALTLVDSESALNDSGSTEAFIASDGAVLIVPKLITDPNTTDITVTYFTNGETGDKDIFVSDIEHLVPGDIEINVI